MSLDSIGSALGSGPETPAQVEPAAAGADFIESSDDPNYTPYRTGARILLFADTPSIIQRELLRGLQDNGFMLCEMPDSTHATGGIRPQPNIVLSFSTGDLDAREHHHRVERIAAKYNSAWMLTAQMHSRFLLVGPLLSIDSMPCYACVWAYASAWLQSCAPKPDEITLPEQVLAAFAAGVICDAIAGNLSASQRESSAAGEAAIVLYDLHTLSSHNVLVGRIPECPVCWPALAPRIPANRCDVALPALFEECSRSRTRDNSAEGVALPMSLTRNPHASHARAYQHSRKVPVPTRSMLYRNRNRASKGEFRFQELAELLFLTFGRWNNVHAKRPDRVLPSAGNLGSPGAFLIIRNVAGVEPGVYFYLEASHELARVDCSATRTVGDLFAGFSTGLSSALPDALLIMIGSYARIGVKYGAFAYRLTHFDSGLFLAHLRTVARSLSITVHEVSNWPDSMLTERLAINPEETPITAVIGFSAFDPMTPFSKRQSPAEELKSDGIPSLPLEREGCSPIVVARHIHCMSVRELPLDWRGVNAKTESGLFEEESNGIPQFPYSRAELWNQLVTRQSVREFDDIPVDATATAAILRAVRSSALTRTGAPFVKVLATLRNGSGAGSTWQTYDLSNDGRVFGYSATRRTGPLDKLFVHPHAAKAPLLFWFCGDVRHGAWQYRQMLLETGRQAYALMQEASCFSLQGHFVGGIWPQRVATTLGLRFCDETPLLAFACGLPQPAYKGE